MVSFSLVFYVERQEKGQPMQAFFTGLIALLFLVRGPIQDLLPGEGITLAWPLYVVVGALIVVIVGGLSSWIKNEKE